jgi:hypothetical protein
MSAFRELGYGAMLYLSAWAGAIAAFGIAYHLDSTLSDFPEYSVQGALNAVPVGAIVGSILWLTYKYRMVIAKANPSKSG